MTFEPRNSGQPPTGPTVSVIMNCYNGERYLRQAIDSVLDQMYQDLEVVFWDNQSDDHSAEIVRSYTDPRIRYFRAPTHTWLYEARNYAIERATGSLLAFLDVDDWWLPAKLERQVALLSDPAVGMVCTQYWMVHEHSKKRWLGAPRPIPRGWVLNDLMKDYFVAMSTLMIRRSALAALDHPCDPRFHIIGDLDLVVRLAATWRLECVDEPMAVYRMHGTNETSKYYGRYVDEMNQWWSEMKQIEVFGAASGARHFEDLCTYLTAKRYVAQRDRGRAFRLFLGLPWGRRKLQLAALLCSPMSVVRRATGS